MLLALASNHTAAGDGTFGSRALPKAIRELRLRHGHDKRGVVKSLYGDCAGWRFSHDRGLELGRYRDASTLNRWKLEAVLRGDRLQRFDLYSVCFGDLGHQEGL